MNKEDKIIDIEKKLEELNRVTGIGFKLADGYGDDVLEKLNLLLDKYERNSNSRNEFMNRLLEGELSTVELADGIRRYHLDASSYKSMYLLDFRDTYTDTDIAVINSLFYPSPIDIVRVDDKTICLIQYSQITPDRPEMADVAYSILDVIETESMNPVRLSYDISFVDFEDAPHIYEHLQLARYVGPVFNQDRYVYYYHEMGMEKILYLTDKAMLREYLDENMPRADFDEMDTETINTIRTFIESNLSIAETARKLYLHRNTLVYRLDKFEKDTGLDVRRFQDAMRCYLGFMICRLI